jgi:hypothetical protein
VLTHRVGGGVVRVRGWGFTMDAPVTVYYHYRRIARVRADASGTLRFRFPVPTRAQPPYYAVFIDDEGNYASFQGLSHPRAAKTERGRGPRTRR